MQIKTSLAMISLILAPSFAYAEGGCSRHKAMDVTASSCVAGTVWDDAAKTCVTPTSS